MVGGLLVAAPVVVVEVVLAVAAVVIVPLQLGSTSVRYLSDHILRFFLDHT